MYKYSDNSLKALSSVDPDMQAVFKRAIQVSLIDFGIPSSGGKRTATEQNILFLSGDSRADGFDKKSYHQTGMAVDVYAYVGGRTSYKPAHLAMIATAVLQSASILGVQVEWGGLWRRRKNTGYGWDMPHFQKSKQR